jgi:Flp pilus assembly protein TadD
MWGIGKAEQAMAHHHSALEYFERAAAIELANVDVWREAAIAASALGEAEKAVQYGMAALKLRPSDAGLHANAAVAFLLSGDDEQAEHFATRAQELEPGDTVNGRVLDLVRAVRNGSVERPRYW